MEYKALRTYLIDHGGGEKYLPLTTLLDLVQKRVNILNNELGNHGVSLERTEYLRGRRAELITLLSTFKDELSRDA